MMTGDGGTESEVVITVDCDGDVTIDHDSPIFRSTSPANSALRSTSPATETANGDGDYDVEREWDGDRGMILAIESKSETVVWLGGGPPLVLGSWRSICPCGCPRVGGLARVMHGGRVAVAGRVKTALVHLCITVCITLSYTQVVHMGVAPSERVEIRGMKRLSCLYPITPFNMPPATHHTQHIVL